MDNKLVKRIVALASSAVMLSSCAFATTLSSASYTEGSLTFTYNADGADKVTYIAYAAKEAPGETFDWTAADGTKYVFCEIDNNDVIVALDQIDGIKTAYPSTDTAVYKKDDKGEATSELVGYERIVSIDHTKITAATDAEVILLVSGDSEGRKAAEIAAPLTVAPAGPTVTFMNGGTEAYATAVAADGVVELPANPTLTAEAGYAVKAFTFVEWVTEDGKTFANANITEDVTVYAKYDTGLVYGDVTGDGQIVPVDRTYVHQYIANKREVQFTNKKVYATIDVIAGDVTGDGQIVPVDRTYIHQFIANKREVQNTNKKIYYINK